jgi:hypothetical protein
MLLEAGFYNFKKRRLLRDHNLKVDNNFLDGVRRGVSNSVIQIIKQNNPVEYRAGIRLMKEGLSKNKRYDVYKTVYILSKS